MMDNGISSINFKIISLNVTGLNNPIKRRKIFKWPRTAIFSKKPSVPSNL